MSKLYNLARMSTATTGTGTIALGAAVGGFLTFAAAGVQDGDTVTYAISDGANSEIGRGVYTASGPTLTRSPIVSTNANAAINLSGSAQVFITAAAEDFGWNNYPIAVTAAHKVTNAEKNATLALGGGAFYAVTFQQAGNYDSNFLIECINEDNARAKQLLIPYGTSATGITIGNGAQAFTTQSGLNFGALPTIRARAWSRSNTANWVAGTATYSGTTLTITVDAVGGSGTFTDWDVGIEELVWPLQTRTVFARNNAWYVKGSARWALPASTIFFIDPVNGSDSNDGLATGSGAFRTGARGFLVAADLIDARRSITWQFADGIYTDLPIVPSRMTGRGSNIGAFTIQGNTTTPANCVLAGTSSSTFALINLTRVPGTWNVQGFRLTHSVAGAVGIFAEGGGVYVTFKNMEFGGFPTGGSAHIEASEAATVDSLGSYTVSGGADDHFAVNEAAQSHTSPTITMSNPAVTVSIASPGVVTLANHGFPANMPLGFDTSGALPTGLATATVYYVKTVLDANTFTVSATPGGAAINTSGTQSGTHKMLPGFAVGLLVAEGKGIIGTDASMWAGKAVGPRAVGQFNGFINTGGSSASLPGSSAGTTAGVLSADGSYVN